MAYVTRVEGGYGAGASVIANDSSHHDSSAHSVLVPDAELLFTGEFHRAGPDLVLIGHDGRHHLIPGYFSSEQPPPLVAPNGAHLTGAVVTMLAGSPTPGEYAQAQNTLPADAIGHVEKVVGDVTVVRNGVVVALNVGDAVYKSDVVQTGANSAAGISFPDGTALNLVANTRMALNEYSYDQSGTANGALFTLVDGTFAFVAGKVAHTGSMKIDTPVATMGIRGTTGMVEKVADVATITASYATGTYAFLVTQDFGSGITGAFDVYATDGHGNILHDANGNPILLATISQNGLVTFIAPPGANGNQLVTTQALTPEQITFQQQILEQLFQTLNPVAPQAPGNNGSSTPPPFEIPNLIPQLLQNTGTPITINNPGGNGGNGGNSNGPTITITPPPTTPTATATVFWTGGNQGNWNAAGNWSDDVVPTSFSVVEILTGATVFVTDSETVDGLVLSNGSILEILSGAALTVLGSIQSNDGTGMVELNSTVSDPTLWIDGTVSLTGGATIELTGTAGDNSILGVPIADSISGSPALLINVNDTIIGAGTIGNGDGNLAFDNYGKVIATGLLTVDTGNEVLNSGVMLVVHGGTLAIEDDLDNSGKIIATHGGAVDFDHATVTNEIGATIDVKHHGVVTFDHSDVTSYGLIQIGSDGEVIFDHSQFDCYGSINIGPGGELLFEYSHGTNYLSDDSDPDTGPGGGTATFDYSFLDNQGQLGGGSTEFVFNHGHLDNQYEINAEGCGTVTFFDSHVDNTGTIAVTAGGAVYVNDSTINNCGGTISVNGADSTLNLSGATIIGGTIDLAGQESPGAITEFSVPGLNAIAPAISGNGLYVAFMAASEVPPGDGGASIWLYNADNDQLTDLSALIPSADLHAGETFSSVPSISGNGEYVVLQGHYQSEFGQSSDLFLYNTQSQTIGLLQSDAGAAALDGNGRLIVSEGNDGGSNGLQTLVMNDSGQVLDTISGDPDYQPPENGPTPFGSPGSIYNPDISADGRYVSFWTTSDEVVVSEGGRTYTFNTGNAAEVTAQVYVYDTLDHTLQAVSVNNNGQLGNGNSAALSLDNENDTKSPMSADGRYVVFESGATNLVAGSGTGGPNATPSVSGDASNVYLYDTQTQSITLVSAGLNGAAANGQSYFASISADGNYVVFESTATNLVAGDTGGNAQTYVYDVETGVITLASTAADGTPADAESDALSALDADGSTLVYGSLADNLLANTTNPNDFNIYLVQETTGPSGTIDVAGTATIKGGATVEGGEADVESDSTLELEDATVYGSTLAANAANAAVALLGGVVLYYVTLETGSAGFIGASTGINTFFDVTILAGSFIQTSDDATIDLTGTTTLAGGTVTFQGAGTFALTGDGAQIIAASGDGATLDNQGNIAGAGQVGNAYLTMDNDGGNATVNANVSGETLTLNTGHNEIANGGTLEATGGGILAIDSKLDNYSLIVASTGSHVQIDADVFNETNGNIGAEYGGTLTIVDSRITNNGSIGVPYGTGSVSINHSHIDNSGLIGTNSDGSVTIAHSHIDNTAGLVDGGNLEGIGADGGGSVLIEYSKVDNSAASSLIGAQDSDSTVTLSHDHITNDGTLDDDDSDGILAYNGGTVTIEYSTVSNSGRIGAFAGDGEEAGPGTFYVDDSTINNVGGTIAAVGANSVVVMSGVTVAGGTLTTGSSQSDADGVVEFAGTGNELSGAGTASTSSISVPAYEPATQWNDSGIAVSAGEQITITATGTISIGPSEVDGQNVANLTPAGDPNLVTGDVGTNFLANGLVPWSLVGEIGTDGTPFQVGTGTTFVATATGELYLSVNDNNFPDNSGDWSATVSLSSPDTVTNSGFTQLESGATLALTGVIDNIGTFDVDADLPLKDSPPPQTNLVITGGVVLEGSGNISLDGATDGIVGAAGGGILDNTGNIISGEGYIGVSGNGLLSLVNDGTIAATTGNLTVDTGQTVFNDGTLEANAAMLTVDDPVTGSGQVLITNDGTADFLQALAGNAAYSGLGTFALADPAAFHGQITGLSVGDIIDLTNIAPSSIESANINAAQLVVDETGNQSLTFNIAGNLTGNQFVASSDGHGGTDLTLTPTPTPDFGAPLSDLNVLIVAADNANDPATQLEALGFHSVSVVDAQDPISLSSLNGYQVVLAYTNYQPDPSVSTVLQDYVNGGGGVVLGTYAMSGTWQLNNGIMSPGYSPLLANTDGDVSGQLTAVLPNDPIFNGINLSDLSYWENANYAHPTLAANATLIATDGDGNDMIARNQNGNIIAINIFPEAGPYQANSEVFQLFGNALSDVAATPITVAAGGTADISSASYAAVVFAGSTGTADFQDPSDFHGAIMGIAGSGDVLDLSSFDTNTTATTGPDSYDSATETTTLTIADAGHTTLEFTLDGNYSASTFNVTSDGEGGVDIVDPPGASTDHGMNFGNDQIALASDPGANGGSSQATSSITVTGDDNFVFHGGFAANTLHTQLDHIDLGHSNSPANAAATAAETHLALAFDPAHNDTIVNHAMDQFHQIVASVGHH